MTFIKKFEKKYHPRLFEVMSIHIDNYLDVKEHGLSEERLNLFIENVKESGPLVIKLVQWAACNSDFLEHFLNNKDNINLDKLKIIHDKCIEQDVDDIIAKIEDNYDDFNEDLFDKTPLGVGSIAQVHKYGDNVIKVTHDDIEEIITEDLEIFKTTILLERNNELEDTFFAKDFFKIINIINIENLMKELRDQTDLRIEANNIKIMKDLNLGENIILPDVIFDSKDVLIEKFLEGENINNFKDSGEVIRYKLDTLILLLKMIDNNIVHADMHEGNILYKNEKILLLDFGIVKKLNNSEKDNIKKIILYVINYLNEESLGDIDEIEFTKVIVHTLCPDISEKDANLLIQRVTISLGLNSSKKIDKNSIPKVIDMVNSFLLKKGVLVNDNIAYCIITFFLIEGNISKKYSKDIKTFLDENIKNNEKIMSVLKKE